MTRPELPADVRRFILTSIPSVPYLEAVLLLRAEPGTAWGVAELARRLYVPERTASELLELLTASGVAAAVGETKTARYAPAPELRELLDQLAHAYSSDLVAITDLIHSRIDRRAQRFADAFRFRKE
jgi:DNA-binding IclR family transcriptional regulator